MFRNTTHHLTPLIFGIIRIQMDTYKMKNPVNMMFTGFCAVLVNYERRKRDYLRCSLQSPHLTIKLKIA